MRNIQVVGFGEYYTRGLTVNTIHHKTKAHIDDLMQKRCNFSANALELQPFCIKPLIAFLWLGSDQLYPLYSGLFQLHWSNHIEVPWRIWVSKSKELATNDNITTITKHSKVRSIFEEIHCIPDSKINGTNMGPTWGWQDPGGPHVDPMNFAIWDWMSSAFGTMIICII